MRILWLTNVPSPYRVDFFNELGKLCRLFVLFEKATSTERDESWIRHNFINFKGIILKGKEVDVDKAICFDVMKVLQRHQFDYIIVSNVATPTGILAIEYMKLKKIPYLMEGDGGFPKNGKGWKERYKKHLIQDAKAYFSTGRSLDDYFMNYGAKQENIYRYPFTSLREMDICKNTLNRDIKKYIRNKLGISEKKIVLSVGQFIHRKGYDVLIQTCKQLRSDTGIYIVGGQPTKEYSQLVKRFGLKHIHFVGYKSKEELKEYFLMADLFVLPTREDVWGLVINEAMAYGLPVITTNRCGAGLELVKNNENGFIIPTENSIILARKINRILNQDELSANMAHHSLHKIKEYSIENMARRHMEVFKELKK